MKEINVCIVGAGNISNTRHIPALKKLKNVHIIGVISTHQENIDRTNKKYHIPNSILINDPKNDIDKLRNCEWFKKVDAVLLGLPPHEHYPFAKVALLLGKDVLVEKPMTMNKKEADELIKLAKEKNLILSVVHNFQYTSGMEKINKIIVEDKYGEIKSILEVQFTNRKRRLPKWYKDLPLGLFYDEAAHFIYLLDKHAGAIKIKNAYAQYNKDKNDETPRTITVNATAGKVPVNMILNFDAPVCEWYYIINFDKRIILYDLFKDIVIDLPTDNEHYSKDILKNDLKRTLQYWGGFIKNGFKMISGNLLYGHDKLIGLFIDEVITRKENKEISALEGRKTIVTMNEIVKEVNKK